MCLFRTNLNFIQLYTPFFNEIINKQNTFFELIKYLFTPLNY